MAEEAKYVEIGMNYVILNEDFYKMLGQGAFANVYRCHKLINKKVDAKVYVAKRIFKKHDIPDQQTLIEREIGVMYKLIGSHSMIMKIYDFFRDIHSDDMWITMEYCEGGDLDRYVETKGPFTETHIIELLKPLAECFAVLHKEGIAHRDLKLGNILLYKVPHPGLPVELRLADFGLARELPRGSAGSTICGTRLYMAPELWNEYGDGFTTKVDVWAFGVILYKMLYGVYCFPEPGLEKSGKAIIRGEIGKLADWKCSYVL